MSSQHPAQSQPQSTPSVKHKISPAPVVVQTVNEDHAIALDTKTLSDDDSVTDMFHFDDDYGIHSMGVEHTSTPCTDDVVLDDDSTSDPTLDVHEGAFCEPTTCRCCSSTNKPSIDRFLLNAGVEPPSQIAHESILRQVFADDGEIHEYDMKEIRHRDYNGPRAHLDDGAQATTTHQQSHLFAYREFSDARPCRTRLVSADSNRYVPKGYGILCVPAPNSQGYVPVFCFYTPDITSCIISPSTVANLLPKRRYQGSTLTKHATTGGFTFTVHSNLRQSDDIILHGILDGNLCYTEPLILPTEDSANPHSPTSQATIHGLWSHNAFDHEYEIHKLSVRADRLLWHQRLGHCSDTYLYHAHKSITGVPEFKHHDPVLDQCPTCLAAKLKKRAPGHHSTKKATAAWQGFSIDFAFTGQASKNSARSTTYKGFNGETSFITLTDHFSDTVDGTVRVSKGAPVNWVRQWLLHHAPRGVQNKYVHMDQGGELFANPKIRSLFKEFGYDLRPTGADSSHQNGPAERAHQTIGNGLRTLLNGANLDARFWPYAYHYYLRIKNALPGKDGSLSSFSRLHNEQKADLTGLRTFGCRVWVRPPGQRKGRLHNHAKRGIFLGFLPNTTKNILWFDPETNRMKIAFHVRFDEGMNDLDVKDVPPNVRHLQRIQDGLPIPADINETAAAPFSVTAHPFFDEVDETVRVVCNAPLFGFNLRTDTATQRVYITDIAIGSSAERLRSSPRSTRRKYVGAFITAVDDVPVFTLAQAQRELQKLRAPPSDTTTFRITLATEPLPTRREQAASLKELDLLDKAGVSSTPDDNDLALTMHALRSIHNLRNADAADPTSLPLTTDELDLAISALQSEAITDEERALGTFSRRKLKTLPTWPLWHAAEKKQLDQFESLGMYGKPCRPPKGAIVLRSHWQYRVKTSGKRRSRNCCDGSLRAAPRLHAMAETYASCIEHPVFRLFLALSAAQNYQIFGGDAQDAFAHSPAPTVPTYVAIDDAYSD
jgi:hypothetical protein